MTAVISEPIHIAGQRAWSRPSMKLDLKRAMANPDISDSDLDEMVEQMLDAVLGDRQVGYMPDMKVLWNRSGQTIWRYYKKTTVVRQKGAA